MLELVVMMILGGAEKLKIPGMLSIIVFKLKLKNQKTEKLVLYLIQYCGYTNCVQFDHEHSIHVWKLYT